MKKVSIYHNNRCSKSRQALQLLKENGEEPDVIEYLKNPLNQTELADLIKKLKIYFCEVLAMRKSNFVTTKMDEYITCLGLLRVSFLTWTDVTKLPILHG